MTYGPEHRDTVAFQPQPEVLYVVSNEDLDRLAEVLPAAFSSIQPEDVAKFIPQAVAADSADVLVSRDDQGQIASVMLLNLDYGAGKLRGHIDDVATSEESRRQGHGGALLDLAIEWFRIRGVKRVALTSNDERQPAHRLYLSRGFVIHDTNHFQLDLY